MKTLVIPDIHHKHKVVQRILEKNLADKVVFLGDWFDDWDDTAEDAKATAEYLKSIIDTPNYVFLFGNHDVPYFVRSIETLCSGNTLAKHQAINAVLTQEDWWKFRLVEVVDGWTLSHAGFRHRNLMVADTALMDLRKGIIHPLFQAGEYRGGFLKFGGCTWLDWNGEFKPVPGLPQIVGHTLAPEVRQRGENYCIDTNLNHVAVIENGKVEILQV